MCTCAFIKEIKIFCLLSDVQRLFCYCRRLDWIQDWICDLLHLLYNGAFPRLSSTWWEIKRPELRLKVKLFIRTIKCNFGCGRKHQHLVLWIDRIYLFLYLTKYYALEFSTKVIFILFLPLQNISKYQGLKWLHMSNSILQNATIFPLYINYTCFSVVSFHLTNSEIQLRQQKIFIYLSTIDLTL